MPISWTEPSSSEASFDSGCARTDGDFGVPRKCFCGEFMKLEVSTTGENRGRKYYVCPASEFVSGEHIEKWWDDAIEEQLKVIDVALEENKAKISNIFEHPRFEFILVSMREMRAEIDEFKQLLAKKEGEIAKLKQLVNK